MNDKYKLATNDAEQTKKCAEQTEAIKTLKKYNKECYSSLTQQVFSAILRTRQEMAENYCKPGSKEFADAVQASKCIHDNALDQVKDAERQMVLQAQVIHDMNIPADDLRMRRACCAVINSKKLFLDATKSKCSAYEKAYNDYVDSYTSEAFSLICSAPEKLDCAKLDALKTDGVTPKHTFFLNPTLKLVKTLDH